MRGSWQAPIDLVSSACHAANSSSRACNRSISSASSLEHLAERWQQANAKYCNGYRSVRHHLGGARLRNPNGQDHSFWAPHLWKPPSASIGSSRAPGACHAKGAPAANESTVLGTCCNHAGAATWVLLSLRVLSSRCPSAKTHTYTYIHMGVGLDI